MSLEDKLYPLLSLYDRLPSAAKWSLGFAYRCIPTRFRRGKHYKHFKRLAEGGETWDREHIAAYQLKELRRTLHHANAYCPYYQEIFARARFRPEQLRTFEDLEACPFLEKADLLEHRERMVSSAFPARSRLFITTGGSTGVPVGFYLQKGISRPKEQAFLETMWKRGGYQDGARLALLRGYVTSSKAEGRIASYDATRNWLLLSSYHLTLERVPSYVAELEKFRPELLYVYPSAALQLAEYMTQSGIEWRIPLKGILCGSERITLPQKRILEKVFKCRAFSWYGHSERVVLAAEGRRSDFLYFVPQYGYVEFGPRNPDGLQEIIGTSFHNLAMPLIRYRTGDYARVVERENNLEYAWPAVFEIAGREQEFLVSATGRKISLTAFNMHDDVFEGLFAVQFYQEEPGRAEFRFIPGPHFEPARIQLINESIRRKLGDDFSVALKAVDQVEKTSAGKHKWLVSAIR
jgi:phenylacetate-CoA ligase